MTRPSEPRHLLICGGGFSGTSLATQLLDDPPPQPLRITLVERLPRRLGRGPAYADEDRRVILNVPAGRMSASSHDPLEFLRFARTRLPGAAAGDYLPRHLFGDYLLARLAAAERRAAGRVQLVRLQDEVTSVVPREGGAGFEVGFAGGTRLRADEVVLACGVPPPRALPGSERLAADAAYVAEPWGAALQFQRGERVLIVGTSLTMADVITAAAGHEVELHALSRHGLLPLLNPGAPAHCTAPHPELEAAADSALGLMRAVRRFTAEHAAAGGDWREAVQCVRLASPQLWARLPISERRRLMRHAAPWWTAHRHRLPAETMRLIESAERDGRLERHTGRLLGLEPDGSGVRARWLPRGARADAVLSVDRVINCTGPDYDLARSGLAVLDQLARAGLASADEAATGLMTSADYELIDERGRAVPHLHYIGPMLRASFWEATAVAELREHAERLAARLRSAD